MSDNMKSWEGENVSTDTLAENDANRNMEKFVHAENLKFDEKDLQTFKEMLDVLGMPNTEHKEVKNSDEKGVISKKDLLKFDSGFDTIMNYYLKVIDPDMSYMMNAKTHEGSEYLSDFERTYDLLNKNGAICCIGVQNIEMIRRLLKVAIDNPENKDALKNTRLYESEFSMSNIVSNEGKELQNRLENIVKEQAEKCKEQSKDDAEQR